MKRPRLAVQLGPLSLPNPVLVASGTFGYGREYQDCFDLSALGGLVTKAVTLRPRQGNRPPRIVETPAGMLNAIGLANPGLDVFLREEVPFLQNVGCPVVVNIAGEAEDEYGELARALDGIPGLAALEVNISCPNVHCGGMSFGVDPVATRSVIARVRHSTQLPVIAKLSPNVTAIASIAQAAQQGGADIISLINTLVGMVIDVQAGRPVLGNVIGGLSGPAIRPVGVRMVWEVAGAVSVPVIGMGGIMNAQDALEYIMAGASAVMIGTGNFVDPQTALLVVKGLEEELCARQWTDIGQAIGWARRTRA